MKLYKVLIYLSIFLFLLSCEPIVTEFPDMEDAVLYEASSIVTAPAVDTLTVMTWNIRFGAARLPWFGDACGGRVILTNNEVINSLENIAAYIDSVNPDILFMQEVDVESKRTNYIDQVQWLLNNTAFNYGAYASMWQSQFVPSDGLGRMNTGNAVLSKWEISDAVRHQLSLRGDQDALTQLFYLRRNALETKITMGETSFYAVDVHATAFATDDTKQKHIQEFKDVLDQIDAAGEPFVAGGDLNSVPPGSDSLDYCMEDMCAGESYHPAGFDPKKLNYDNEPAHREGSWFVGEDGADLGILTTLYDTYTPAIDTLTYQANEALYFTHTPDYENLTGFDRKLDYLWTNRNWINNSDKTHWEAAAFSDHLPVTARWVVGQ